MVAPLSFCLWARGIFAGSVAGRVSMKTQRGDGLPISPVSRDLPPTLPQRARGIFAGNLSRAGLSKIGPRSKDP